MALAHTLFCCVETRSRLERGGRYVDQVDPLRLETPGTPRQERRELAAVAGTELDDPV